MKNLFLSFILIVMLVSPAFAAVSVVDGVSEYINLTPTYTTVNASEIQLNGTDINTGGTLTNVTYLDQDNVMSGTLKCASLNATTDIELNGTSINTGGTLSNVAYLDQQNTFSVSQNFSQTVTASEMVVTGYSNLGLASANVKMLVLTGTCGASEGDSTAMAHGISNGGERIVAATGYVNYSGDGVTWVSEASITAEYIFGLIFDDTNVTIQLHPSSSGQLTGDPCKVLVWYTENAI